MSPIAAVDPRLAIAHFIGRPLLLMNAKQDQIVKQDMAERLFNACPEPKRQVWYDCGHLLTENVHAPLDVDWTIGVAAADLVVEDDRPFRCEPFEGSEVVVRRTGSSV